MLHNTAKSDIRTYENTKIASGQDDHYTIGYLLHYSYFKGKLRQGHFRISGQSLINKNYHNSRTCHDNDIELGPVTELDKRNTAT